MTVRVTLSRVTQVSNRHENTPFPILPIQGSQKLSLDWASPESTLPGCDQRVEKYGQTIPLKRTDKQNLRRLRYFQTSSPNQIAYSSVATVRRLLTVFIHKL